MQQGQKSRNLLERLPAAWRSLTKDYEFIKIQGQGSFGQVVKATHKAKNKTVAIKYIADAFDNIHSVKRVYREIAILRRLSTMEDNIFTVKLLDVIMPEESSKDEEPQGIFLVMSHVNQDLAQIFNDNKNISFDMEHAKIILYNLLCAVNFLHTANVLHRDLKPSNVLLTDQCSVKICDFGLARTVPEEMQEQENIGQKCMEDQK